MFYLQFFMKKKNYKVQSVIIISEYRISHVICFEINPINPFLFSNFVLELKEFKIMLMDLKDPPKKEECRKEVHTHMHVEQNVQKLICRSYCQYKMQLVQVFLGES